MLLTNAPKYTHSRLGAVSIGLLIVITALLTWSWDPGLEALKNLHKPEEICLNCRYRWAEIPFHYPLADPVPLPRSSIRIPQIQHQFSYEPEDARNERLERRDEVKKAFSRCWTSYKERAWLQDELTPISGSGRNTFSGWAATLVDALDTLWIMDMKREFNEAVNAVADIDFSAPKEGHKINFFETTIRYLGGLLGAYDLSSNKVLLNKAIELGDMLHHAFDTPNHLPILHFNVTRAAMGTAQLPEENNYVAELGSFYLEFTRLSQITGNSKWYDHVHRVTNLFSEQQQTTKLPGMWPVWVNSRTETLNETATFSFGGTSDSIYEYLPKQYILLEGGAPIYRQMYESVVSTVTKNLLFRPMTIDQEDILFSGLAKATPPGKITLDPRGEHLSCYAGGMLALGGKIFDLHEHLELGRKLTAGCAWAYSVMPSGIMPEIFHMERCPTLEPCEWISNRSTEISKEIERETLKTTALLPPGFIEIDDKQYKLRPEAIESLFVMYRVTGDRSYQDTAWDMFLSIDRLTKTDHANAQLEDVTTTNPTQTDHMESFWLAETLKYFYLIFSEPSHVSLDEFVLNTEAHPFRLNS